MTDQRLPIPGQDDGTWGAILNAFLGVAHDSDGNLLADAVSAAGGVTTNQIDHANGIAPLNASSVVPTVNLGSGTASSTTFLRGDGTWSTPAGSAGSSTLAADTDVAVTAPATGQVLTYDNTSGTWKNQALPTPLVTSVAGHQGVVTLGESDISGLASDLAATEKTAHKGQASGYAPLDSSSLVPVVNLGSGSASSATYLRGDGTWATPAGGGATLDTTDGDIAPLGSQAAGSIGKAADAGHVHAMPRLDQVGAPTASISANSQKITSLANGTLATDAAAFGQIPVAGMASGTYAAGDDSRITGALQSGAAASGDLSGTLPSPTVAKINGIAVTGTPDLGDYLIATGSAAASWQSAPSFSSTVDGGTP